MKIALRTALFLVVLAVGGHAAAQQALVSEDRFTLLYAEALRVQSPDFEVEVTGPLQVTITHDDEEQTAYLDNAYTRYRAAPDMLDDVIADYVLAAAETARTQYAGVDVTRIVPVMKEANYLADLQQGVAGERAAEIAHERYNDHLIILYAEDTPHNIRYLSEAQLDDLGIDRAGLRAMAVANLDGLLPDVQAQGNDGTYMLIAGGNYEASLLLIDEIWTGDVWRDGTLPVSGDLVVAVPSRDVLLVTGSDDAKGLALVREIADDIVATEPYYLTNQLFIYRDGRFQPYDG